MEQAFIERLIDFGALGIMTLAMGFILWQYWKRDRAEKERLIKRLEDCCKRFPDLFKLENYNEEWGSYNFIIPKKYISVRPPKILSAEHKQKLTSNLETARMKS
jgi:hypothetical protein